MTSKFTHFHKLSTQNHHYNPFYSNKSLLSLHFCTLESFNLTIIHRKTCCFTSISNYKQFTFLMASKFTHFHNRSTRNNHFNPLYSNNSWIFFHFSTLESFILTTNNRKTCYFTSFSHYNQFTFRMALNFSHFHNQSTQTQYSDPL